MINFVCPVSKEPSKLCLDHFKKWVSNAVYEVCNYSMSLENMTRRHNASLYREKLCDCGFLISGYNFDTPLFDETRAVYNALEVKEKLPKQGVQLVLL